MPAQALGAAAPAQLLFRLGLDLAHALAREAELVADLLERQRLLAVQPEAHADHVALLLVELLHERLDLLVERRADELDLRRRNDLLLQRVAELGVAVAHRRR